MGKRVCLKYPLRGMACYNALRKWCCMGKLERHQPAYMNKPFVTTELSVVSITQPNPAVSAAAGNDDMPTLSEKYQYDPPRVTFRCSKGPVIPRKRAVSLENSKYQPTLIATDNDRMQMSPDNYIERFCTPVDPQQYEPHEVAFRCSKGPVIPRKRAVSLEVFDDVQFTQYQPTLRTTRRDSMHPLSEKYLKHFSTPVDLQQSDPPRAAVRFSKSRVIPSKRAVWFEDTSIVCQ